MEFKKVLVILSASIMLLACTEESKDINGTNSSKPEDASKHKISECPLIEGRYLLDTSNQSIGKEILLKPSAVFKNGIDFTDTGVTLNVDGKSHIPKDAPKGMYYVGTCSKSTLTIDYFDGNKLVGKLRYSQDNKGALIIETISNSKVLGKSTHERWVTEVQKNEQIETSKNEKGGKGNSSIVKQKSENANKESSSTKKYREALNICNNSTSNDGEGMCKGLVFQDKSFCKRVDTKDAYAVCMNLSDKTKDENICEIATSESAYRLCMSIARQNKYYCDGITSNDQKTTCKAYFSKGEVSCRDISSGAYYSTCEALVTLK
jgi:hypothetical protein